MDEHKGFTCMDCGDSFALKTSWDFHMERRVMIIQVYCNVCRNSFVFHNRCKYMEHRRSHLGEYQRLVLKNKPIYKDVQVMALQGPAMEQALDQWLSSAAFQKLGNLFVLYEEEFGPISEELKKLINVPSPPTSCATTAANNNVIAPPQLRRIQQNEASGGSGADSTISAAKQMRLDSAATHTYSSGRGDWACTECQGLSINYLRMRTLDELKRHFVYNLPPNHKQFICVSCNAVYFSLCSYQAHKRTHLNSRAESRGAPYTCAECGLQQPTAKALTSHLLNHRWAPTILNAWRCEKCFTFYSNSNTLVVHFASHCQSYFKCPACPTAFQGVQSFEEHRRMMHPEIKEPVQPEPAPKCLRCEGIYLNKDQLVEHLKTHLNSMSPFKVFRCPICGRLMENKSGLLTHYWRSHRVEMKSEEVLEIPVQLDELKQTSMASSSQFVKIAPKLQRGEQTQSQPQPQCPSGSDGTTEFRYKTGGITFPTRCSRCPPEAKNNRIFTNLTMLQMHMTARHRGEMGGGAAGKDNPVVTSSSVNPIGSVSAGTLHHRPAATTSPKGVNQQQAAMKGGLACKKYGCFFVAATKHEMRGHAAAEHRDSQNYLCLECGLSCVTEGSLRRHLTIAHQIVDPVQYIKEYEDCLPLMYNKKVGNNNASSCYKCTVCGENFHTESELNIHSRSHGMLFLQQRSAQQSGK